jgi:16S rRNA (cytidine1402-2'-O)-methyltransferase
LAASPIGHLGDASLRLIEALCQADLVAAEDTRRAIKLLNRFSAKKPLISYREQNHDKAWPKIEKALAAGGRAVLLTDAGSPGVADPGAKLVQAARAAGYPVYPLPGPSAVVTALTASGFWAERFIFGGFLPERSAGRVALAQELGSLGLCLVFFEVPHRLATSLADLARVLGPRPAFLAREMTKAHEEYLWGTLEELAADVAKNPRKGEITLVVAPGEKEKPIEPNWDLAAEKAAADPRPLGVVAAELALELGWPKKSVYGELLKRRVRPPGKVKKSP